MADGAAAGATPAENGMEGKEGASENWQGDPSGLENVEADHRASKNRKEEEEENVDTNINHGYMAKDKM